MPFGAEEFKKFAEDWNFQLITTSPYLSRAHGAAERCVQTAKSMIKKCDEDGTSLHYALLQYRNTPLPAIGVSPAAQLLYSRHLRTLLPVDITHLRPAVIDDAKQRLEKYQANKNQYDHHAKRKVHFEDEQEVYVKKTPDSEWTRGKIVRKADTPRSYFVHMEDGTVKRRSTQHLKWAVPRKETLDVQYNSPVIIPFITQLTAPLPSNCDQSVVAPSTSADHQPDSQVRVVGSERPMSPSGDRSVTVTERNLGLSLDKSTPDRETIPDPDKINFNKDKSATNSDEISPEDNESQSKPSLMNPETNNPSNLCVNQQSVPPNPESVSTNSSDLTSQAETSYVLLVPNHILQEQTSQTLTEKPQNQSTPIKAVARKSTGQKKRRSLVLSFPPSVQTETVSQTVINEQMVTRSRKKNQDCWGCK